MQFDLANLLTSVATLLSVSLLVYQIKQSDRFKAGEFINSLEQQIADEYDTYRFLIENRVQQLPSGQQIEDGRLLMYLGFFEKLLLIIEQRMLPMDVVDRMFAYRFFLVANHPYVQERVLLHAQYSGFFTSIFVLHRKWTTFRAARTLPVPFSDHDLSRAEIYRHQIAAHRKALRVSLLPA